jgi:hypothetical protein
MAEYIIFDNFLDKNEFELIKSTMIDNESEFPWYVGKINYPQYMSVDERYNFQFCHTFYDKDGTNSKFFYILHPIIYRITAKKIFRIKANLNPVTHRNIEHSFHIDMKDCITGIYYVNSNNGYTIFKDGDKIESVENRMVLFNSNQEHSGASCTDQRARYVINFNYVN